MSTSGYDKIGGTVVSGRALEARALIRSAMALQNAMNNNDDIALIDAITMNNRLWLFFYSEIESGNVTLPIEVANNIVSLVAYVVKVAPRACAGEQKVLETLISINRNIAAGLMDGGEASGGQEPPMGTTSTGIQSSA